MTSPLEESYASLKDSTDFDLISDLMKDVSKQSTKMTMDQISTVVKPKTAEKKKTKEQLQTLKALLNFIKGEE